jgi:hypothetical protein
MVESKQASVQIGERLRTEVIYAAELNRQLRLKKHKLQRLADAEPQARKLN